MDKVRATASGVLGDALLDAGQYLPMPCRQRHTCGKCGVYIAGDVEPPGAVEAALLARSRQPDLPGYDYRLACLTHFRGEASVIASSISGVVVADVGMDLATYDGSDPSSLGLAVDIGTTTVTVLLFRLGSRERLADASELNHQVAHGADVLSRIDAANRAGVWPLQSLIIAQLNAMIDQVLAAGAVDGAQVTRMTVTGNTTMLHLLTGLPVQSLGVAPFTPVTLFGQTQPASSMFDSLTNAELYLPPAISTYVGPDITCGIVATGLGAGGRPELLIDLGTNGEMALALGGRLWCCATAAGPAFEGAEISSGMPALPGAIEDVFVDGGAVGYTTIEHRRPKGVCGTGLISAVNTWLDLGVVDESGAMDAEATRIGGSEISLTRSDVRKLQLAKAAVAAGIDTLLSEAGLAPSGVAALNLAGGFGSYLQAEPAIGIGLLPAAMADGVTPAGNSALSGAVLLTLSTAARRVAKQRADEAIEVSLATHSVFMDRYIENMAFRGDD